MYVRLWGRSLKKYVNLLAILFPSMLYTDSITLQSAVNVFANLLQCVGLRNETNVTYKLSSFDTRLEPLPFTLIWRRNARDPSDVERSDWQRSQSICGEYMPHACPPDRYTQPEIDRWTNCVRTGKNGDEPIYWMDICMMMYTRVGWANEKKELRKLFNLLANIFQCGFYPGRGFLLWMANWGCNIAISNWIYVYTEYYVAIFSEHELSNDEGFKLCVCYMEHHSIEYAIYRHVCGSCSTRYIALFIWLYAVNLVLYCYGRVGLYSPFFVEEPRVFRFTVLAVSCFDTVNNNCSCSFKSSKNLFGFDAIIILSVNRVNSLQTPDANIK